MQLQEKMTKTHEPGAWKYGDFTVIVSIDAGRWHMSISHPSRDLTYKEIKKARNKFLPGDVTVAMIFPPKDQFVNVHKYCFHLWEIPNEAH